MEALETTDNGFDAPTMSDDKLQRWLQDQETPLEMIETREGRGGQEFYYLRHQYVTEQLNKATGHNWDFEVLRERMDEDCITVLGKLTLRVGGHVVTKSQYGSSDVKRKKNDKPLSIGDDFKAAASDALKKCASLIGLGLDLGVPIKDKTRRHLHAVGTELCNKHDADWDAKRHKLVRTLSGGKKQSSNDLLDVEARIIIAFIESHLEGEALTAPVAKEFASKL